MPCVQGDRSDCQPEASSIVKIGFQDLLQFLSCDISKDTAVTFGVTGNKIYTHSDNKRGEGKKESPAEVSNIYKSGDEEENPRNSTNSQSKLMLRTRIPKNNRNNPRSQFENEKQNKHNFQCERLCLIQRRTHKYKNWEISEVNTSWMNNVSPNDHGFMRCQQAPASAAGDEKR